MAVYSMNTRLNRLEASHPQRRALKILFVAPYVPSPSRVRSFNLIRQLTALGHEVAVLTTWTSKQEHQEAEELRDHCRAVWAGYVPRRLSLWNCLLALPAALPLQAVYCWKPDLVKAFLRGGWRPDVIHVEHMRGARYGLALRTASANGSGAVPVVWDSADSVTMLLRQATSRNTTSFGRWLAQYELHRMVRSDGWLVGLFSRVVVPSGVDRTALMSLLTPHQDWPLIDVLPNGVDLDFFHSEPTGGREAVTVVIDGNLSQDAHVAMVIHFVRAILPSIWARRPEVQVHILGANPPRGIRSLADDRRITLLESAAAKDRRLHLQHATAVVAPLTYGTGAQNQVLEAMACGAPVVASPRAIAALRVKSREEVLVAQGAAPFADTVVRLLDDTPLQRKIGAGGRRFVEKHHRWETVASQLVEHYDELIRAQH